MSSIESALCAGGTYYPVRVGLMSVQRIEDMKFERVSIIVIDLNKNNVVCAQPSTIPVRTIPCGGACLADEGGAAGRPGAARPERQSQRLARVAAARARSSVARVVAASAVALYWHRKNLVYVNTRRKKGGAPQPQPTTRARRCGVLNTRCR
jgi:hypothetical protein